MSKLNITKIVIFKHGVSYYLLEGKIKSSGKFELEFRIDEMDDVLKSLFVLDTSEKGYISSISYDAALDTAQLLKSIMLDIPDTDSFSSLITQTKGAGINLIVGGDKKVTGTIMGIELVDKIIKEERLTEKLLILLDHDDIITKIPFTEIKSFELLSNDLKKDLKFFLETVIAGKKKDAKKIIINCESGGEDASERTIMVSYITESPIWKTSYRLIMSKQQAASKKCLLSGWALIENTTNSDWENVELSLVAGMPVSFKYEFYRPIYMERPVIQPPKALTARPTEIEEGLEAEKFKEYAMEREEAPRMKAMARMAPSAPPPAKPMAATMPITGALSDDALLAKVKAQTSAQTKDLGELFEYNITNPVSIKRKQSALVPILTEIIKAKRIILYNKNDHDKNPNACLEITNDTTLTLERGPVTIIYDDNLAGEAIMPFLNKEDTRLLNFAVEQAVIITHEEKSENLRVHKVAFGSGYSYEYYHTNIMTTYKIKNKTNEEKDLYLDHPKTQGYKIIEKPVDPEETPNYWRFKISLKPKDAIVFDLKEQRENYSSYYIWNWSKEDILKKVAFYIEQKFINKQIEEKLKKIAEMIGDLNELKNKKSRLEIERDQMTTEQERLRENISVLGNTTQEESLREKYVKKLAEQENRFETIKIEINLLDQKINDLNKEIEIKINELKVF